MISFGEFLSLKENEDKITKEIKDLMQSEKGNSEAFAMEYKSFSFSKKNGKDAIVADYTTWREEPYDEFMAYDLHAWVKVMNSEKFKKFLEENGYKARKYTRDDVKMPSSLEIVLYI